MRKNHIILIAVGLVALTVLGIVILRPKSISPVSTGSLSYDRDFNDLNNKHMKAAKVIGVEALENRRDAKKHKKKVVEIKSNKYYEIRKLSHSIPFLVPEAALLVEEIGIRFQARLKELNAPIYKLQITSVTRSKEDIKELRKSNINASENSVHVYATTVDISWARFSKVSKRDKRELSPDYLKKVLGLVLRELKQEGYCYVKHEKKQACFHITARKRKD